MGLKYDLFVLKWLGNIFWALQLYFEVRIGLEQGISGRGAMWADNILAYKKLKLNCEFSFSIVDILTYFCNSVWFSKHTIYSFFFVIKVLFVILGKQQDDAGGKKPTAETVRSLQTTMQNTMAALLLLLDHL